MMHTHRFAYAQARLQSRHGERPDEQVWRQLEAQQVLANFLQNARRTSLRPWVLGLHANDHWHLLEYTLLQQFHHYIDYVAGWQPATWQAAVRWVRQLLYLPALQFLLADHIAPRWMLQDTYLKPFAIGNLNQRLLAMQQSASAPLITAWQNGEPLLQAWQQHWQSLWPAMDATSRRALHRISTILRQHLEAFPESQPQQAWREREFLARTLVTLFRRYTQQPAAVFLHLALVALDFERLRGNIMQRALFPELKGEQP